MAHNRWLCSDGRLVRSNGSNRLHLFLDDEGSYPQRGRLRRNTRPPESVGGRQLESSFGPLGVFGEGLPESAEGTEETQHHFAAPTGQRQSFAHSWGLSMKRKMQIVVAIAGLSAALTFAFV